MVVFVEVGKGEGKEGEVAVSHISPRRDKEKKVVCVCGGKERKGTVIVNKRRKKKGGWR